MRKTHAHLKPKHRSDADGWCTSSSQPTHQRCLMRQVSNTRPQPSRKQIGAASAVVYNAAQQQQHAMALKRPRHCVHTPHQTAPPHDHCRHALLACLLGLGHVQQGLSRCVPSPHPHACTIWARCMQHQAPPTRQNMRHEQCSGERGTCCCATRRLVLQPAPCR